MYLNFCSGNFYIEQSTSFLISALNSFQGMLKISGHKVTCDLILVEPDGKCQSLAGTSKILEDS